jgi:hypothetical protein
LENTYYLLHLVLLQEEHDISIVPIEVLDISLPDAMQPEELLAEQANKVCLPKQVLLSSIENFSIARSKVLLAEDVVPADSVEFRECRMDIVRGNVDQHSIDHYQVKGIVLEWQA